MRSSVDADKLKKLFRAHQEGNDDAFRQAAESIISEELAANHHSAATELRQALGQGRDTMNGNPKITELAALPKDRRNGEDLLFIQESRVTPDQVVLMPETAKKVARIVEEHRSRDRLGRHGYRPKSKLLFWGPPGNGKTLTAHHLAHELGLPIGVVRLNAVISSFLGDTAAHLQRVFTRAAASPMVLLMDEVDAVGKNRDDPNDVGELKRVVNSLLQGMDSFRSGRSVLVAASNHQYLLDPALWRRFDDVISFPTPEAKQRLDYLRFLLNGVHFEGSLQRMAANMTRMSFADIERVSVEAVKTMLLDDRDSLRTKDMTDELRVWRSSLKSARTKSKGVAAQ